jgi:hypothetical protein
MSTPILKYYKNNHNLLNVDLYAGLSTFFKSTMNSLLTGGTFS